MSPLFAALIAAIITFGFTGDNVHRPYRITGIVQIADQHFRFVSGGRGRGSMPYGDWEITPDDVGDWGERHHAIGLAHGKMFDPKFGNNRSMIEIHQAIDGNTAGCLGIISGYPQLRRLVLGMIKKDGQAWLHFSPSKIEITPQA